MMTPAGSVDAMFDAMRAASGEIDLEEMFPAPAPVPPSTFVRAERAARRYYFLPEVQAAPPPPVYVPMPENTGPASGIGPCQYEGIEIETDG